MADKKMDKQTKESYLEYQITTQHLKQLQQQVEKVQEQLSELIGVSNSIDQLKRLKKGVEMMIPVANGIFLKTRLDDNSDLLVNVGSNTVVKKSFAHVMEMLARQQEGIEELYSNLIVQFQKLHAKSAELEEKLKKFVEESEN